MWGFYIGKDRIMHFHDHPNYVEDGENTDITYFYNIGMVKSDGGMRTRLRVYDIEIATRLINYLNGGTSHVLPLDIKDILKDVYQHT